MDEKTKERETQKQRDRLVRQAAKHGLSLKIDGKHWELEDPGGRLVQSVESTDIDQLHRSIHWWLDGYADGLTEGFKQVACKVCHGTGEIIDGTECAECSGMGRVYSKSGTLPPPTKKQITAELVKAIHRAAKKAARPGACDRSGGEITALAQALVAVDEMADDAA